MNEFAPLLRALVDGGVEFIVIGGLAAAHHGAARATYDVDVLYNRSAGNIQRLTEALAPIHPYLRGAPPNLPFRFDPATVKSGLNFTLVTDVGPLDCLGEVAGIGTYDAVLLRTKEDEMYGVRVRVLDLDALIEAKRAAGRPKDFEAIAELEVIREEREKLERQPR